MRILTEYKNYVSYDDREVYEMDMKKVGDKGDVCFTATNKHDHLTLNKSGNLNVTIKIGKKSIKLTCLEYYLLSHSLRVFDTIEGHDVDMSVFTPLEEYKHE